MTHADRLVLGFVAALAMASAGMEAARHRLRLEVEPVKLELGANSTTLCQSVRVRNPTSRPVVLDGWVLWDNQDHTRIESPISVDAGHSATGSVCFSRIESCGDQGAVPLISVEVRSNRDVRKLTTIPLHWFLPCEGWVRRGGDERGFELLALVRDARAIPLSGEIERLILGQADAAPPLPNLTDAATRAHPTLERLGRLVTIRDIAIGLPDIEAVAALDGTRKLGQLSAASGWAALAQGRLADGVSEMVRTARLGAIVAVSRSWEGRVVSRVIKGSGVAAYAGRGLACVASSAAEDAETLADLAEQLRLERTWRIDAFDPSIALAAERAHADLIWSRARMLPTDSFIRQMIEDLDLDGGTELRRTIAAKVRTAEASLLVPEVAIAVRRYRLAHGAPPPTLEALVPTWLDRVPDDPRRTDGAPLRYRAGADGSFAVWSAGPHGRDDGGDPAKDLVVAVPAHPAPCEAVMRLARRAP